MNDGHVIVRFEIVRFERHPAGSVKIAQSRRVRPSVEGATHEPTSGAGVTVLIPGHH